MYPMHNVRILHHRSRSSIFQRSVVFARGDVIVVSLNLSFFPPLDNYPVSCTKSSNEFEERQLEFISFRFGRWIERERERENEWKDGRQDGGKKWSEDREQRSELSIKFAGRVIDEIHGTIVSIPIPDGYACQKGYKISGMIYDLGRSWKMFV